jgi:hypothetical protein
MNTNRWIPRYEHVMETKLHDGNILMPVKRTFHRIEWLGYTIEIFPPMEPIAKATLDWVNRLFNSK